MNQEPARSVQTPACATRDIHVPVAHGVHPARRPSGVLLLTRVTSVAALEDRLGFKLKAEATARIKIKIKIKAQAQAQAQAGRCSPSQITIQAKQASMHRSIDHTDIISPHCAAR
ncbi:hypothetical protein [Lysobacter capsici]|uniref:hypothetical protein n=1 Tax=Lysobacter capsici TaxID=435897 RepID=UPI00287BBB56|nr:hypothetical protein [Lysobacter capsici]WND79459.1 hypothetical protein RJ610_19480 [Lysobacter capsici]WND84655.1 hypothetical protein RJ609_19495 [Lysobacter capsici]